MLQIINRDTDLSTISQEETHVDELYPSTWEGWVQRYAELEAAYVGERYSEAQLKRDHLFRALDEDGKILALTRRLTRDVQHVVNTDANALTGGTLTLSTSPDAPADAAEVGAAIWQRSRVQEVKGRWSRRLAALGDWHAEAVLGADGRARIVYYDPQCVLLTYDAESGTTLQRADIRLQFFDPPEIDPDGAITDVNTRSHVYVRQITPEEINVYIDGQRIEEQSGRNVLGVVSLVHVPFVPWKEPERGLWAASGLEAPLGLIDSLLTQVLAIGTRHGNPILMTKGFRLGNGSDVFKHGRVVSGIPTDGDMAYVEMSGNIARLLDAAEMERQQVRSTLPEFLFSDSGANESGEARSYRAAAFEGKMEDVRGRFYPALARLTQLCYHLEHRQAYDEDATYYSIDAPPVLPRNRAADLAAVNEVWDRRGITREDYVRHLQRLDFIDPEEDPAQYVERLDEGLADTARAFLSPAPATPTGEPDLTGPALDL